MATNRIESRVSFVVCTIWHDPKLPVVFVLLVNTENIYRAIFSLMGLYLKCFASELF